MSVRGSKDKKPNAFPPNTIVGNWKPHTFLGGGGQGSVWAAKPVNVKHAPQRAFKACFAEDEQAKARFVREVEILEKCDSPHILKVYDRDLEWKAHVPGLPAFAYYVSEKCSGSMEEKQKSLGDPQRRLELFKHACSAVTYLHSMPVPVIHRDIKPANFLIGNELSNAILADFGIARPLTDGSLTQAFEVVGTPYYRAPEVHHGGRGSVQSDVYSLGRVLEWLLTGDVSTDMATRSIPRGAALDDEACSTLDGVIAVATQVTPANRYPSVQALADQLPDLWLSVRAKPKQAPSLPDMNAATVVPTALALARSNDTVGWRQLQNLLRRDLVERLTSWRGTRENEWPGDRNKAGGALFTDEVLDIALARFAFALTGVFSNNSALADQRQLIEDLLSIPTWSGGGMVAIADAPRSLAYLFHYLHGALCMVEGHFNLALELARMSVTSRTGRDAGPLWKDRGMTGWPALLGGQCDWAWEYLCQLRARHPILEQFFALDSDYEVGLAAYSMLLTMFEIADDASRASPEAMTRPDAFKLNFPPLFIGMQHETIASAARRTLHNARLVEDVARLAGANVANVRKLWPERRKQILVFCREVFDNWGYLDNKPIPADLG